MLPQPPSLPSSHSLAPRHQNASHVGASSVSPPMKRTGGEPQAGQSLDLTVPKGHPSGNITLCVPRAWEGSLLIQLPVDHLTPPSNRTAAYVCAAATPHSLFLINRTGAPSRSEGPPLLPVLSFHSLCLGRLPVCRVYVIPCYGSFWITLLSRISPCHRTGPRSS